MPPAPVDPLRLRWKRIGVTVALVHLGSVCVTFSQLGRSAGCMIDYDAFTCLYYGLLTPPFAAIAVSPILLGGFRTYLLRGDRLGRNLLRGAGLIWLLISALPHLSWIV